VAIHSYPVR
jgi:hypothetical protein